MDEFLEDERIPLEYSPIFNEYYIPLKKSKIKQGILYCPWCDSKLPVSLRDQYFEILEKEHGIDAWDINDIGTNTQIPSEFKSDEWWKKRGL
jgi:hypothetical protein